VTSDPTAHLQAADCFVLASRWEGFGVALVEALQCGLPLLAADCEFGPADVITARSIGSLVRPNDPESLAEGLRMAVTRKVGPDDVLQRHVAARAYARDEAVATHFSALTSIAPQLFPGPRTIT
jgi:glycosyltransferase involved in cell wall biosynthesis